MTIEGWLVLGAELRRLVHDEKEARDLATGFGGAVFPLVRADSAVDAYLATTSAGVTEEQTQRVTEEMASAFALGASMGDGKFTSDSPHLQAALDSSKARIMAGLRAALAAPSGAQGGEL
ncbi:hypothetical protein GGQ99_000992 [Aminobacter niigataensis]|uniref:Uncharacterized protein n=1 Tax=Aminobacter niigataensis TaxID=83265 RepID=A0ABR6KXW2_9HYPH|nr:hypothetical protein [Aminobacter niigataensis]MBB4649270.1 hypothetical protein [Aminobacter niigataensis]